MGETAKVSTEFVGTGYSRPDLDFVLNRSFTQFGQPETVADKTVDQFFVDYEDLFYEIPAEGPVNSHEYLVRKSSEFFKLDTLSEDIQPLLDEITLLRSQSVVDQQTIIDLRTQLATVGVNPADTKTVASLRTELAEAINESGQ